eukprot:s367_g15.t1
MRNVRRRDVPEDRDQPAPLEPEPEDDPPTLEIDTSILNTEDDATGAASAGDRAEHLAMFLHEHGLPEPFARYSPEHMVLWLIIRGRDRITRAGSDTERGRLWALRVQALVELLEHLRTSDDPTVRDRAMQHLLNTADFSDDEESPFNGMTPDERHQQIDDVGQASEFGNRLIEGLRGAAVHHPDAFGEFMNALRNVANAANEHGEEEAPTSDVEMEDGEEEYYHPDHPELLEMQRQRRRTMRVFRLNRDAALERGDLEEAAYWENQEDQILYM